MKRRSGFARIVTTVMTAALLLTGTLAMTPERAYADSEEGVVNVSSLNLRTGASLGYGIIDVLGKGTSVEIVGTSGDWYKINVSVGGSINSGFVYSDYITVGGSGTTASDEGVTAASGTGLVNVGSLNVRSNASLSAKILGVISSGSKVTITGVDGDWYQVSVALNGGLTTAYVYKSCITVSDNSQAPSTVITANGTGVVNVPYLNFRSGPSTSYPSQGCLPYNSGVEITGKNSDGTWYRVNASVNGTSVSGYVCAKYVDYGVTPDKDTTESSTVTNVDTSVTGSAYVNCDGLYLRAGASIGSQVITLLSRNTVVTIEGTSGDWCQVTATSNGAEVKGYVYRPCLAMGTPSSTAGPGTMSVTADEEYLLACIVYCEAGDQSYEGQLAVANVVLNRVRSPQFPNTISGVIYQSGQFTPAFNGRLANALANGPYDICKQAAADALAGNNNVEGYYFFNGYVNVSTVTGYMVIGDHTFYYY